MINFEEEIAKRDARIEELESCISSLLQECDPMQLNAGEPWCRARSLIDDQQIWTCSECGQATTDEYEHFDHIADCGGAALKAQQQKEKQP